MRCLASVSDMLAHDGSSAEGSAFELRALQALGVSSGADRCYLFERDSMEPGRLTVSQQLEWSRDGVSAEIANPALQKLDFAANGIGRWLDQMLAKQVLQADVSMLPADERPILDAQNIQSILLIPLFNSDEWVGFVGFDAVRTRRDWDTSEVDLLRIAGHLIMHSRRRIEAERRYEAARDMFETVIREEPLPIIAYDADGVILCASRACFQQTGLKPDLVHDINDWTRLTQPDRAQREELRDRLRQVFQSPEVLAWGPMSVTCRDGSVKLWTFHARCVKNDHTPCRLAVMTAQDQTELSQARRFMSISQRSGPPGELLSSFTRQAETMLSEVRTLLRGEPGRPLALGVTEKARGTLDQLGDLLGRFKSLAAPGTPQPRPVHLNQVVESALDQAREEIVARKINLGTMLSPDLWPVFADPDELAQAVIRLVDNALEALEGEGGRLSITTCNLEIDEQFLDLYHGLRPGRHVYLSVEDSGQGIPAQNLAQVFQPFFGTRGQGRGLGLPVAQEIVRAAGGRIAIYSEPFMGTTAKVFLPAHSSGQTLPERRPAAEPLMDRAEGGETILIVDDEEVVLAVGGAIFEKLGYRVLRARNGEEGVRVARAEGSRIDVVLLDMTMPVLSGESAFPLLRDICPAAKIVLCSGFGQDERVDRLLREGAAGFLQKPFRASELGEKLRQFLQRS